MRKAKKPHEQLYKDRKKGIWRQLQVVFILGHLICVEESEVMRLEKQVKRRNDK